MDLFISTACPQCGADLSYEEEATVVRCGYCGSQLRLTGRSGVIRTYIKPRDDVGRMKAAIGTAVRAGASRHDGKPPKVLISAKQLLFAPYWRIKGMACKLVLGKDLRGAKTKEIKTRLLDHTFPAFSCFSFGLESLGVRPSATDLSYFDHVSMSKTGSTLNLNTTYEDAAKAAAGLSQVCLDEGEIQPNHEQTRLIEERFSVIYFPFWVINLAMGTDRQILILDAVANTLTRSLSIELWQEMIAKAALQPAKVSFSQVQFIAFKCPNCGWDLPLGRHDIVHVCGSCGRAWTDTVNRLSQMKFEVALAPSGVDQDCIYLPFWVFEIQISDNDTTLSTAEELDSFFGLSPTRVVKQKNQQAIRFYVPASSIRNATARVKLATTFTQRQPIYQCMPEESISQYKLSGVSLSSKTAFEMAEIILWSLVPTHNRQKQKFVQQAKLSCVATKLLWWPFQEQGLFLRDAICSFGIQKGTVNSEEDGTINKS